MRFPEFPSSRSTRLLGIFLALAMALSACESGDYSRAPVVFVHGNGLNSRSFDDMRVAMQVAGYPKSYLAAIDLDPSYNLSNITAAESQIAPFIDKVLRRANSRRAAKGLPEVTRVDLVTHSMGGMSTRWYIKFINADRVRSWISIAGPNHGSGWGCPGPTGSAKSEVCPPYAANEADSEFQFKLNGLPGPDVDETPFGLGSDTPGVERQSPSAARNIVYLTIRIRDDEYILPSDSTIIDGAGGVSFETSDLGIVETSPGNYLFEDFDDHDNMPSSSAVIQFVIRALEARDANNTSNSSSRGDGTPPPL